jgi:hypothetical protein
MYIHMISILIAILKLRSLYRNDGVVSRNVQELDPRRVQGFILEIIFSAAVPFIDEHHFKGLIRRGIKEYSRKN